MGDTACEVNNRGAILIVDDDLDIRESLGMLLELAGFSVVLAKDGSEALRHLREGAQRLDVVFLDLRMPVMNGWQFLEEQRRDPRIAAIPTVIMTADRYAATAGTVQMTTAVLLKPCEPADIINTAARLIKSARSSGASR